MSALKSLAGTRQRLMRVIVVGSVLALVSIGLVAVPAFGAHRVPPAHPTFSNLTNEGVLRLHLGDTDYFEYQEWSGTDYEPAMPDAETQDIGPPIRCELKDGAVVDGPLAVVSAVDGHNVGLVGDDAGLRKNGSRGTPCGLVDVSEGALSVSIASGGPLDGKEIDYAEVDIEGKHDVAVSVQAYLDDSPVGTLTEAFNCETDTDCGPDSADLDNFRVIVAVLGQPNAGSADVVVPSVFNRLDFVVSSTEGGEFSLNGGSDGTDPGPLGDFLDTNDSLFHITDVTNVTCNAAPTPLGEEGGLQGTFFLANCGAATGKAITFEADNANNEVTITNVGAGIPGAYTLETWIFLPVPPDSVLEYNDGAGFIDAQFCLIDPRNSMGTVDDGIVTNTVLPAGHTTCVVEETRTTLGQFDFGAGLETGIEAQFILFSTGDSIRRFK